MKWAPQMAWSDCRRPQGGEVGQESKEQGKHSQVTSLQRVRHKLKQVSNRSRWRSVAKQRWGKLVRQLGEGAESDITERGAGGRDEPAVAWLERARQGCGWTADDERRIDAIRQWVTPEVAEIITLLTGRLVQLKETQPLMSNTRFVKRLHEVLQEWFLGLLESPLEQASLDHKVALGRKFVEIELEFEDIILLESMAHAQLQALVRGNVEADAEEFVPTMDTLNKALCLHLALLHRGYFKVRDAVMERTMLDRFLAVTGFSRTLYENLAGSREWGGNGAN